MNHRKILLLLPFLSTLLFAPASHAKKIDGITCMKLWKNDFYRNPTKEFKTRDAREGGAKIFKLYQNGEMAGDYESDLRKLRPGDVIDFGGKNGKFIFKRIIGYGYNTVIIDVGRGWALRLSFTADFKKGGGGFSSEEKQSWIEQFYDLQRELKRNGVPVVDMDAARSRPPQFVLVKIENFRFDLGEFLKGEKTDGTKLKLTDEEEERALQALDKFAASTWMYNSIGDFAPRNLGYNGKEWLIFDTSEMRHSPITDFDSKETTFDPVLVEDDYGRIYELMMPEKLAKRLSGIVADKREEMRRHADEFIVRDHRPNLTEDYVISQLTKEPLPQGLILKTNPPQKYDYSRQRYQEKDPSFTLTVGKRIKQSRHFSVYEVFVKNGPKAFLTIARTDGEKSRRKLQFKADSFELTRGQKFIAAGDDYILSKSPAVDDEE